jgi:transposase-like protein
MNRVRYLGKTVKGYLRLYQDVPPICEEGCTDCQRKLYRHGRYYRSVVTRNKIIKIPIYRWLCPACGKTFSLLPDFLFRYHVHSEEILQKAWLLRYAKGKSYNQIQTYISTNVIGGISYKTVKKWDGIWKNKKSKLINFLLSNIVENHPIAFDFQAIKPLTDEQALIFLLPLAWKIFHPSAPYPFCGFFKWINQLIHRI